MPEIMKPGDRVIRSQGRSLIVNWAKQVYVVSEETMRGSDAERTCWICRDHFKVGDGMTAVHTDAGIKLVHRRCWDKQQLDD
jgi:hypothetical protein